MNKCIPCKVAVVSFEAFQLGTGRNEIYTQSRVGHLVFSFSTTKPPAHPEDECGIISRNVGKPHHDAAVCPRNFE